MLISSETKNITDFLVKGTSLSAIVLQLFKMYYFTGLQVVPAIVFSFNTLPRETLTFSLQKYVSNSTTGVFLQEELPFV